MIWCMRWYMRWYDMIWYDIWDDMIYDMIRYMILLYNTVHIKSSVTKWPNISSKNSRDCSQHHEGNASIAVLKLCRSVPPAWRSTTDLQCPEVEQLRIKTWGCHKAQLKLGIMLSYSFEHIILHIYIYTYFFLFLFVGSYICLFIYFKIYLFVFIMRLFSMFTVCLVQKMWV